MIASNLFLTFSSDWRTPLVCKILFLFYLSFSYVKFYHLPLYLPKYLCVSSWFNSIIFLSVSSSMELVYFSFPLINVALAHLSRPNVMPMSSLNVITLLFFITHQVCNHFSPIILSHPCKIDDLFSLCRFCIHSPWYWVHRRGALTPDRKVGETMSHPGIFHTKFWCFHK